MPMIRVQTSVKCSDTKEKIVKGLSGILAQVTGKPERYCFSMIEDDAVIAFAGNIAKGAFIEVKGIGGLTPDVNKKLSAEICAFLKAEAGIDPAAIYINFTDVPGTSWGWNGSTFA